MPSSITGGVTSHNIKKSMFIVDSVITYTLVLSREL